jgi:hypothetical protein
MMIHPLRNTHKKIIWDVIVFTTKIWKKLPSSLTGFFFAYQKCCRLVFIVVGGQTKTLSISFEFRTWLCGLPDAERIWHVPFGEHTTTATT